jgi:4,5-dihydroxyphthalate decarboxylase
VSAWRTPRGRWGPLTTNHPVLDRIGDVAVGDNVQHTPGNAPLVYLLAGDLDAVMTPFMPPGFYGPGSPFRPLYADTRTAEVEYFGRHGFVPGIHLLALRSDVLRREPEAAQRLLTRPVPERELFLLALEPTNGAPKDVEELTA